jgi:hypothetical protein
MIQNADLASVSFFFGSKSEMINEAPGAEKIRAVLINKACAIEREIHRLEQLQDKLKRDELQLREALAKSSPDAEMGERRVD